MGRINVTSSIFEEPSGLQQWNVVCGNQDTRNILALVDPVTCQLPVFVPTAHSIVY